MHICSSPQLINILQFWTTVCVGHPYGYTDKAFTHLRIVGFGISGFLSASLILSYFYFALAILQHSSIVVH